MMASNTVSCVYSEVTGEEEQQHSVVDMDNASLDVDIVSVLHNRNLRGDEKWFQYYRSLERYLYKRDPTFRPLQFKFEVHEDSSGQVTYTLKKSGCDKKYKYLSYLPAIVGPVLGAALSAILRWW